MFEISQGKHNSLDCHNVFLKYFPLIAKFTCSRLNTNQNYFCLLKTFKLRECTVLFFSMSFFNTKCAPFLLKIEEDFNIDD